MVAPIICLSVFMAIWFGFFLYVGSELPRSLGGAFTFYFLLPVIASLPARYREFLGVLWSIVITLSGLIALNYLFWVSPGVSENDYSFGQICAIITPFIMIEFGFIGTLISFLVPRTPQNEAHFFPFVRLLCFLWMLAVFAIGLGMVTFKSAGLDNVFQLTYHAGLGALILGRLVFLMKLRKFTPKMLRGAVKQTLKLPVDRIRCQRKLVLWTIVLLFFSFSAEHLRKAWILWTECAGFLVLFVAAIAKFGEVPCINASEEPGASTEILLPGMRAGGLIFLFVVAFVIFMVVNVFIAIYL